jgi:hypothetical protein
VNSDECLSPCARAWLLPPQWLLSSPPGLGGVSNAPQPWSSRYHLKSSWCIHVLLRQTLKEF